jgi:DNA repair protein RAD50
MKAQKQIQNAETSISASDMVSIELTSLRADKEEKQARLKRSEMDRRKASYETRLAEMASQITRLEEKREELSSELQFMSAHSESRAKLDLKQDELRRKRLEFNAT